MSWPTTYRPKQITQLHLKSVRDTFQQLMKTGQLPQVFLFAGPKGTGKTSTARILGALLNDPDNTKAVDTHFFDQKKTSSSASNKTAKGKTIFKEPAAESDLAKSIFNGTSFVVQEMDAASNRGIDDVRALRERVSLPPQEGKMAVYILDEAHMLTTEAFNALLKLLEEPPTHAVFVLATTEFQKIPDTIVSRCSVIQFEKASPSEIQAVLTAILDQEGIAYEAEAIELVAQKADGSFRDAVKLLEFIAAGHKKLTVAMVPGPSMTDLDTALWQIIDSVVITKDEQQLVAAFEQLRKYDADYQLVFRGLFDLLHRELLLGLGVEKGESHFKDQLDSATIARYLLKHLCSLPSQETAPIELLSIELTMLELLFRAKNRNQNGGKTEVNNNSNSKTSETKESAEKNSVSKASNNHASQTATATNSPLTSDNLAFPSDVDTTALLEGWHDFIKRVEQRNTTVAALLRSSKPIAEQSNGIAKIEVFYKFHRDQLRQPKFLTMLQECAQSILGQKPEFDFILSQKPTTSKKEAVQTQDLETLADEVLM